MQMEKEIETETETETETEMEVEMDMETEMEVFGARKACSELKFASKWVLTFDFEVLEASGVPKSDQESPESSQEAPNKLPRSPQEAPKRLLGGVLGALGGPRSSPSRDPRDIHRSQSLQEPSRRSPSHDLSALPAF